MTTVSSVPANLGTAETVRPYGGRRGHVAGVVTLATDRDLVRGGGNPSNEEILRFRVNKNLFV